MVELNTEQKAGWEAALQGIEHQAYQAVPTFVT